MKQLKGKLGDMDYNLSQLVNPPTTTSLQSADTQSTVCKVKASLSED